MVARIKKKTCLLNHEMSKHSHQTHTQLCIQLGLNRYCLIEKGSGIGFEMV